jgi:hypothetical protein
MKSTKLFPKMKKKNCNNCSYPTLSFKNENSQNIIIESWIQSMLGKRAITIENWRSSFKYGFPNLREENNGFANTSLYCWHCYPHLCQIVHPKTLRTSMTAIKSAQTILHVIKTKTLLIFFVSLLSHTYFWHKYVL